MVSSAPPLQTKRPLSLSSRIINNLESKHEGHINIRELRLSSGFGHESRIDLWTIDPSPATGNIAVAYEVKISRRDWKKDGIVKQRGARLFADRFFYATPPGLLTADEIPDWAGLVECDPDSAPLTVGAYNIVVPAPKLDKQHPSWGLVVSMLRRVPVLS